MMQKSVKLQTTRRWPIMALMLFMLLAGGCSMFKLAYNNADIAINWTLDGYFDLRAEQHALLKTRLESLQTWHRKEELPAYVETLTAAQTKMRQPVSRDDIHWFMDAAQLRYRHLVQQAAPGAAELLVTLTPEQIKTLEKKYAKNNKKFASEHKLNGNLDDQRNARTKKMIKTIEEWVGNLSTEQEGRVVQAMAEWPLYYPQILEDRKRRQREFVWLLEKNHDAKNLSPLLENWLEKFDQGRAPEYDTLAKTQQEKTLDLILEVDRMLTPKQRARLIAKVQDYIDDFSALMPAQQVASNNP